MNQESKEAFPFYFLEELVLRTPALPFMRHLHERTTDQLLEDESFLEAIYLASPVLYAECKRLKAGHVKDAKEISKIRLSLVKYYQRMYSRCTPFGLFSGCSVVKWSADETRIIMPSGSRRRSTRLDMHYLCALAQHLASIPEISDRLSYFPNTSAYRMGEELRYVEYSYREGRRQHQITSVAYSDYLQNVLDKAADGATAAQLTGALTGIDEITEEEALEFIRDMISNQVLISEMDPAITGEEFIHQLLNVLKRINEPVSAIISDFILQLEIIIDLLDEADEKGNNPVSAYASVIDAIQQLGVPFEESKLFQADMFYRPVTGNVNDSTKQLLIKAIRILTKLFSSASNENLSSFANRFRKRYEDQEVPLLSALDAETGVGYIERAASNLSPLLENLAVPAPAGSGSYDIKWNRKEEWLFNKLLSAGEAEEVIIDEKELDQFQESYTGFPPSLSVMFSLTGDGSLVFRGANGSSAANLLGRFAHGDEAINQLVKKITIAEQEQNNDVIFAEIVHLPEDRVGNILLHPAFREYEIPFLARSSQPLEQQVALQDITIRVSQDKVIRLFSKKLNKEIIPRLTNAHNFSFRSLPVYYFLSELQTQGMVPGLLFNWGSMARHFKRLPRVRCGQLVLSEATWQLPRKEFLSLAEGGETILDFQQRQKLPPYFVLVEGDNEMLVDISSGVSANAFIKALKGREIILLKEFHQPDAGVVTDELGRAYNNQLVAVLMNEKAVYRGIQPAPANGEGMDAPRIFMPGSEWLYYKIYCGTKTADELLLNAIAPLTGALLQEKLIDKWFFIRYNDPDFHLRIRFHLPDVNSLGRIMQLFHQYLEEPQQAGLAWNIQTDTYQREMERYGNNLTVQGEELFFTDSKTKIEFLLRTEGDEREKYRWAWALRGVDELLSAFDYPLQNKFSLIQEMQRTFAAEFNADTAFFRQLNQQYNNNRKMISLAMENPVSVDNELKPLLTIFDEYRAELRQRAEAITTSGNMASDFSLLDILLNSYIHMSLNRIFLSEPRLHELVIYDMLCSHYRSLLKRKPTVE